MQLILSIFPTIFNDFYLPIGFSAKFEINCTALSTVSDNLSSNLSTIKLKSQKSNIYIFP